VKQIVELKVNGLAQEVAVQPHHTLLDVLRNEFKLFGTREGCGIGMCGACTVLVDGKPISSCLALAALATGQEIVTIEGLTERGELHPIQQAFIDYNAFQCSYCTPGFILATKALLEEQPNPSGEDVRAYLAGNLCRCGSYVKIEEAVLEAARRLQGAPAGTSAEST
jgi:aerobic-type carbon monoxide dehydrogenase small subunit (CoxS/CutS family)